MARIRLLVLNTALIACAGSGDSREVESGAATADSAVAAASTPTSSELKVSNVMIGRRIGAGNRVIEPTFEFAPGDTVYLSVSTQGTGGASSLTAAWRSQAGEIVQQSSESIGPAGENTAFQFSPPKGLKPGTYKVVLFLGEDSVDTKVFVVKK